MIHCLWRMWLIWILHFDSMSWNIEHVRRKCMQISEKYVSTLILSHYTAKSAVWGLQTALMKANSPLPLWARPTAGPIKWISAKEHFISICPQPQNTAINSSFEHSGKQIGTLTGEWLEEALLPIPPGLAGGSASVPIQRQSLCFIIQRDSMRLERRTQMGATDARCQPLALSLSLSPLSTCTNTYARPPTLTPSVPFGKPKLFAFVAWWALSIYLLLHWNCQIQKPRGSPRCVPALLAEGPCLLPLVSSFIHTRSLYRSTST